MADKAISQLNAATSVTSVDLFVLEQSGEAKKLTGQILENWLVSFADGHGGIQSITKTGSTGTNPVIDTYTILLADETTTTFQVVNGIKGDTGDQTYVWIRYAHTYPTADSDMGTSPDEWIGIYSGTSTTAPTHYTDYTWYQFKGETGDTGAAATITAATVGYQQSDSGSVVPEGSWTTTVPTPVAGKFLWTRIQIQFNTGSSITAYSVARYGIDGTGAVSSVNSVSPDQYGNVQLVAGDIQALDSQSVQAHLDDDEQDIADLKTSITHLRPNQLKRRWIFIADSYGHASGTNNGWIDKLVTLMGLSVDDYYQSGIGGAGFTTSSNSFLSMITTLAASISDKNSITDIVVCGGANDTGVGADTISTAVKAFVSYCETTFPNALVSIGMIAGTTDTTRIGVQYERTLRGYEDCGKARFLQNLQFVFHDYSLIGNDGVHPTATGYTVLADKIYQALMGGCSVNYYEVVTPTPDSGYTMNLSGQFAVAVSNDITTISMTNRIGKLASSSSYYFPVSAGTAIKICNIPSKYIKGVASGTYAAWEFLAQTTTLSVHSTINNTFYEMPGWLTIYNGALYVTTVSQVLATTSAFNSCDSISVLQTSMTAPTMFC